MRRFEVEVSGLPDDVDDGAVRAALASAVADLHRSSSAAGEGFSVGTSGGRTD